MENKYQEAYATLESSLSIPFPIEKQYKLLETLRELVDKATPKHIILVWTKIYEMFYGVCPTCGEWKYVNIMNEETSGYCERCGQKLDWSKEV